MSDVPAPIELARQALTRPVPLGAKTRVARALRSREHARSKGPIRTLVAVLATLVTTTAAAVGVSLAPHWIARVLSGSAEPAPTTLDPRTQLPTKRGQEPAPESVTTPVPGPDLPLAPAPELEPPTPRSTPAPRPSAAGTLEQEEASQLAQQVDAYREAVALLDTSPGLAVVRLRAFEERWPKSALREEASFRLVQALIGLGRRDDARVHAQSFLVRYPHSAKRFEMRALVEEGEGD